MGKRDKSRWADLKCKIGKHQWSVWDNYILDEYDGFYQSFFQYRRTRHCYHCGKIQDKICK